MFSSNRKSVTVRIMAAILALTAVKVWSQEDEKTYIKRAGNYYEAENVQSARNNVLSTFNAVINKGNGNKSPAGAEQGSYYTDHVTGAFCYQYPIDIPKLTAGPGLDISINYNSQHGADLLGLGGYLNGIPKIMRDKTYTVNYNADDHFVLDGEPLVKDGSLWRTEINDYSVIKKNDDASWTVLLKDGSVLRFGTTEDSRLLADGNQSKIFAWGLSEIEDSCGNRIEITYKNEEYLYPSEIKYIDKALDDSTGGSRIISVYFEYQECSRFWQPRISSQRQSKSYLLKRIAVNSIDENGKYILIKEYEISYIEAAVTGQYKISKISEYGNKRKYQGVSHPSIRPEEDFIGEVSFDWAAPKYSFGSRETWITGQEDGNQATADVLSLEGMQDLLDYDGDGLAEFFGFRNTGKAFGRKAEFDFTPDGDYNRDGLPDYTKPGKGSSKPYLNNGNGLTETTAYRWENIEGQALYDFSTEGMDIDGNEDGKLDEYGFVNNNRTLRINGGTWTLPENYTTAKSKGNVKEVNLIDMNCDNLPDLVWTEKNGNKYRYHVSLNWGNGFGADEIWLTNESRLLFDDGQDEDSIYNPDEYKLYSSLIDMNGDGLPDRVRYSDTTGGLKVAINNGTGFQGEQNWGNVGNINAVVYDIKIHSANTFNDKRSCLTDVTGDGLADRIEFVTSGGRGKTTTYSIYVYRNQYAKEVVKGIRWSDGRKCSVEYKEATAIPGVCDLKNCTYPVVGDASPRLLVSEISENDGFGQEMGTVSYGYGKSYILRESYRKVSTLGFAWVSEEETAGTKTTETKYYYSSSKNSGKKSLTGLADKVEFYGTDGKLYTRESSTYEIKKGAPLLSMRQTEELNGNYGETCSYKTTYAYNDYGDITEEYDYGGTPFADDVKTVYTYYTKKTDDAYYSYPSTREVYAVKSTATGNLSVILNEDYKYRLMSNGLPSGLLSAIDTYDKKSNDRTRKLIRQQKFEYKQNGALWKTYDTTKNYGSRWTEYERDTFFNALPKCVTNPAGGITEYKYDECGCLTEYTDENGYKTEFKYDAAGRVVEVNRSVGNEKTCTVNYSWFERPELDGYYEYESNPPYVEESISDESGDGKWVSRKYYNAVGLLIQEKTESESSGNYRTVDYGYYANGQLKWVSQPYLSTGIDYSPVRSAYDVKRTICYYDEANRLYRTVHPDGSEEYEVYYSAEETYHIDGEKKVSGTWKRGNMVRQMPYWNTCTATDYSGMKSHIQNRSTAWKPSQTVTETYADKIVIHEEKYRTKKEPINIYLDALGNKIKYEDPDKGIWTYKYDGNGRLIEQNDACGNRTEFTYYSDGKLKSKNTAGYGETVYEYTNSNKGNLLKKVTYPGGIDEYAYTPLKTVKKHTRTLNIGGTSYTKTEEMTYTRSGLLESIKYPDGETVTYGYNDAGMINSVTGTASYVMSTGYTEEGWMGTQRYGNTNTVSRKYDYMGRVSELTLGRNGGSNIHKLSYEYDRVGNIRNKTDLTDGALTESYTYDNRYRLVSSTGGSGLTSHQWMYDDWNNMTKFDSRTYGYGESGSRTTGGAAGYHAATSVTAGNGKAAFTYKYNANGDMVEAKSSGSTKTFTYNSLNRMTGMTVTGKGAGSWTYSYDADGERTVKKNNTTGTYTVYWFDNYEETYKTGSSSVALTESVKYYKANDGVIAQRVTDKTKTSENEKLTYLFKDVLGSTVKVCDENGNVTEFMGYVPYGEQVLLSGSKDAKKTYTGQEPETDDGLYYYHARYYDSSIGRFIQADSVLDGLNRYCYCGNNPINFCDPTGKQTTVIIIHANVWWEMPFGGSHVAVHFSNPSGGYKETLYDPSGCYEAKDEFGATYRTSSGVFVGEQANLNNYINDVLSRQNGETVNTYTYDTTPEQEANMIEMAFKMSDGDGFQCAYNVSSVMQIQNLMDVSLTPGGVEKQARKNENFSLIAFIKKCLQKWQERNASVKEKGNNNERGENRNEK